jgi:multiple sugar transport system substrate-binding protein
MTTGLALLESATYDGSVYGFPRDIGFSILYYNKDFFDAAGVAYPTEEWTLGRSGRQQPKH